LLLDINVDIIKVLEDGDLETLGREDYGGQLNHPLTAHPKLDPVTGPISTRSACLEIFEEKHEFVATGVPAT
jgi:hypothetical protein